LTADQQGLITDLIAAFQTQATAPNTADILAIPGNSTNTAALPISGTLANKILVNSYTRSGVSCNAPITAL
jgi:hypothetical protein